jgi:TIR domain-containing protein
VPSVAGFWSYAHSDNENDENGILNLAERLRGEYELLTAESLELFIDRGELLWGDDWRERIALALERVTFFIPIITPTYFRRQECRAELLRFSREAKERGAERLILPVYYIGVPEFEDDEIPADEAMAIVKPLQRQDLRRLRLESRDGAGYRTLVNSLAERIIQIARNAEEGDEGGHGVGPPGVGPEPSPPAAAIAPADQSRPRAEDEEGFFLENMARGETALQKIQVPMNAIAGDIRDLGRLTEEATGEMDVADAAGRPTFASRLTIAKRLASRLVEPAESLEGHAKEYVSLLWDLDPFVTGLLDLIKDLPEEGEDVREPFLSSLQGLYEASAESSASVSGLIETLEENANFSRELRQPLRVYQTSLRNILDAQAVIEQWADRANEIA